MTYKKGELEMTDPYREVGKQDAIPGDNENKTSAVQFNMISETRGSSTITVYSQNNLFKENN